MACGTGEAVNPGRTTAGKGDGMLRQPPAAKVRACRGRRDPCGQRDAQLAGPMFHRSGLVRPYVPPGRAGPGRGWAGRGAGKRVQRSPLVPRMVTGAAVGASDHRLIAASMVSRRCTQVISDLAYGAGVRWTGRRRRTRRGRAGGAVAAGGGGARCMPCLVRADVMRAGVWFSWKIGPSRMIRAVIGYKSLQVSRIFHDLFR